MFEFVKCPCCAAHEAIGQATADVLEELIFHWLIAQSGKHPALTEMHNILNHIRNDKERQAVRAAAIDRLLS